MWTGLNCTKKHLFFLRNNVTHEIGSRINSINSHCYKIQEMFMFSLLSDTLCGKVYSFQVHF